MKKKESTRITVCLFFAKAGNLPGEIETTTEAPATEESTTDNGFEEVEPEVTDDFVELPSFYAY